MPFPFEKHFYHKTLETYLALFDTIMSKIKIDTERGIMEIPITVAIGRRSNLNKQQNSNSLPFATIMLGNSFEVDKSATSNRGNQMITENARSGNRLPIILPIEYNVRTKKYGEMLQIVEQIYAHFYPTMDCNIVDNNTLQQEQGVKIKILSHDIQDNWEGDGTESVNFDGTFQFEINGWLYGQDFWVKGQDGSDEDPNKIKTIIIDRGLSMDILWPDLPEWFRVDKDGIHHPEDSNEQ